MSTLIRTDEVPEADRLDYIEQISAQTWVPMNCCAERGSDCVAVFRASGLGPLQVVVMDVPPGVTVTRTPELIEQADPDLLKLLLVCGEGSTVVTQAGRQARISNAEFALYD